MVVQDLNRIFNGDDVFLARVVDIVNQAGKSGGLAAACGAGYQKKAPLLNDGRANLFGNAQLFQGKSLIGEVAHDHAKGATLTENNDAETMLTKIKGKIGISFL